MVPSTDTDADTDADADADADADVVTDTDELTLYWIPGCSSCLRMKEFVEKSGVPHRTVNAVESPESQALLEKLDLTAPAAVKGGRGVPGVNLVAVAELAGFDYTPPTILAPEELRQRYLRSIGVAEGLIETLSADDLEYQEPDRPRPLRHLCLHLSIIMRGFTDVEETNIFYNGGEHIRELATTADVRTILEVRQEAVRRFDEWWDEVGQYDGFDRIVESKWGHWTLHEAFERAVWHTTQHTRQLQFFVQERLGKTPPDVLGPDDLAGLPLPEGIHAGGE